MQTQSAQAGGGEFLWRADFLQRRIMGSGVAQLILSITFIGLIVSVPWVIIDFIMILSGNFADKNGNRIEEWW